MKFKASLTDHGVHLLEKRFVAAFERIGRNCHVYLTPSDFFLLHNALSTDGVQAICQFPKDVLFSDYRISSQNSDRIAFAVDLSLLSRALRSSQDTRGGGERLQMKLVKKSPSPSERALPFLSLETKADRRALVQDVPISQPLGRADVAELQQTLDLVQDLPQTFVQMPDLLQLQSLMERLRNVGDVLEVGVSKAGVLSLRTSTPSISITAAFRNLPVWGSSVHAQGKGAAQARGEKGGEGGEGEEDKEDKEEGLSSRMSRLQAVGEASIVAVRSKHFCMSLHCHHTRPDASYCGVDPQDSCLLLMFQFSGCPISLQYRLPLLLQSP